MDDAIAGELVRRQELLRRAGNYASLRDYEKARAAGAPLAPLPSLLIICDEFTELLTAKPDFIDLFVQIGRVGRSLGVHLLLASQRLEEGRLRGLDTHLSYRIGLRTFSAMESRVVLGVPDAYELPRSPGHGYLKSGTEPLIRFKAAYVSGAYRHGRRGGRRRRRGRRRPGAATTRTHYVPVPRRRRPTPSPSRPEDGRSRRDACSTCWSTGWPARARRRTRCGCRRWPSRRRSTSCSAPLAADPARGLTVADPELHGALQVPVGVVDKPFEQRRDLLWLDLAGAAGHVAVVGGPQSGKRTLLRTLICGAGADPHARPRCSSTASTSAAARCAALRDLPHVGGVAGRLRRRRRCAAPSPRSPRCSPSGSAASPSWASTRWPRTGGGARAGRARRRPVRRRVPGRRRLGARCASEYEDLEPVITDIATRGPVATASTWSPPPPAGWTSAPAIRDLFGTRLELRLGDPSDSMVDRRAAANVPEQRARPRPHRRRACTS